MTGDAFLEEEFLVVGYTRSGPQSWLMLGRPDDNGRARFAGRGIIQMPAAAEAELWRTIKALAAMNLGQNAVAVTPSLRVLVRYKQGDREVTDAAVIAVVDSRPARPSARPRP